MTSIVWFSYPPDYRKLALSIESARLADPAARCHVVIKPGDDPPEVEDIHLIRSDFPQGHKLVGAETVMGIARTLARVATGDTDIVVKLDSDMLVLHSAFWRFGGIMFRRENRSYVGAYALSADLARLVSQSFTDSPTLGGHEAIEICKRARSIRQGLTVAPVIGRLPRCLANIP